MSEESTTVFLIRHGRTAFNRDGVFRGRMDVPLDEVGRDQAASVGRALVGRSFDALYSSPLLRALETARAILEGRDLELRIEEAFNNLDLGPWTGRPRLEVAEEDPESWRIWLTRPEELELPGAEPLECVADRSAARLDELVSRHAGGLLAVVSHRAVLKPLLARVLRMERPWFWRLGIDPASISVLTHRPERGYTLMALNRNHHLAEAGGHPDDA